MVTRFTSKDSGTEYKINSLNKSCKAPAELILKVGAQVLLLKNVDIEQGLVNGARGKLLGLSTLPCAISSHTCSSLSLSLSVRACHHNSCNCLQNSVMTCSASKLTTPKIRHAFNPCGRQKVLSNLSKL